MSIRECTSHCYAVAVLALLILTSLVISGCSSAEASKTQHVSRGQVFLKEKKFQEASIEFRNAIQIDSRLAIAHWGLAQAFEGLQRWTEVIEELRRTTDLDKTNLDARVKLGTYLLLDTQHPHEAGSEAERLARDVLQKDPNHIEGHILLANVLIVQDPSHAERALGELVHAISINPRRIESYISLARFQVGIKDVTKAEETFRRAISIDNRSSLAHGEYGKFLVQVNRGGEAEFQFRMAVDLDPSNHEARSILASFYLVNKQFDKAEQAFKALAELDRGRPEGAAVLADFYSSVGRYDEAVNIYVGVISTSPEYLRGRYRLAEIMLMRGDITTASSQVAEVLKKNQHDMEALLLRSRIRMAVGEPKQAIEDLKEVLTQEPNHRAALYFMAEANLATGNVDQARAYAGDLQKYYSDYLPARLLQAQINLAAGYHRAALRITNDLVDRLAKAAPDRDTSPQMLIEIKSKVLSARGSAEMQLGDNEAARQDFQRAGDANPGDPNNYINLGMVAQAERQFDEAIAFYERALAIDGMNFNALQGLINAYAGTKRLDLAQGRIENAISFQPQNASLHYLKAQVHGFQQDAHGVESELRRTLELDPRYVAAYSALAALYVKLNREDQAIAEYKRILEQHPDDAATYSLIGMLQDSRQNHTAAADNYRKALEIDPNSIVAANNLAWDYAAYATGNLDEAVRLAQGVVQRYPDLPGFADTLGWVYYKKELHAAAVEQLQKAVAEDEASARKENRPMNPIYHFHLGMALAGKGDRGNARRELERSLRIGEKTPFLEAKQARKTLSTL